MNDLPTPEGLRIVTSDLRFPEGPIAMPDGSVIVCELGGGAVSRVQPDGTVEVIAEVGGGPNGAAIGPDGMIYLCNSGGSKTRIHKGHYTVLAEPPDDFRGGSIQRIDPKTGRMEVLYASTDELPLHGPNDIVFDSTGGFYFTDFGRYIKDTVRLGGVFYGRCDGAPLRRLVHPLQFPNGIGLSPDGTELVVAQTYAGVVVRWTVVGPGEIVRHRDRDGVETSAYSDRRLGAFLGAARGRGEFDSLAVEADGSVCVATIDHPNGGITTFRPDGTREFVALPETTVTNICFGGEGLRQAFITMAHSNRLATMAWPRAGLQLAY